MAKTKDPIYLTWRSTHGAVTGSAYRTAAVARRHFVPIRRVTVHQESWVSNRSPVLSSWRSLSPIEQGDWTLFGQNFPELDRYGVLIELSGWNWFNRFNTRAAKDGLPFLLSPPADPFPTFFSLVSIFFDDFTGVFRLSASVTPVGNQRIYVTRRLNLPLSYSLPPSPFPAFASFFAPNFPDPAVSIPGEFLQIPSRNWLETTCVDSLNRSAPPLYCWVDRLS